MSADLPPTDPPAGPAPAPPANGGGSFSRTSFMEALKSGDEAAMGATMQNHANGLIQLMMMGSIVVRNGRGAAPDHTGRRANSVDCS